MKDVRKKIFIADDDEGIVEALQMMLDYSGYDVALTSNNNVIDSVKNEQPDLILLDVWMSGIDGRDICLELKQDITTQHIPIILLSANKDTGKIAEEVGANSYMEKPFDMTALVNKIEELTA